MVAKVKAFPSFFYNKSADAARADVRRRHSKYDICICYRRVGDENLTAVEHIMVAFQYGCRLCTTGVAACIWLCQTKGAQLSPLARGTRYFCFCSSVPNAIIG